MTVASELCRGGGAPLKIPPIVGSNGFFRNKFVGPPKSGVFLRGAPPSLHKSEATVIDNTPNIS